MVFLALNFWERRYIILYIYIVNVPLYECARVCLFEGLCGTLLGFQ